MSDGPHKSLPMNRKWKFVAESADNRAFSLDEVCAAQTLALESDFRQGLSSRLVERAIANCDEPEALLFQDEPKARFEALRPDAQTEIDRRFLDNVLRLSGKERGSISMLEKAMVATIVEQAAKTNRQMEEHYLRKANVSRASWLRTRLEQVTGTAPIQLLARKFLKLDSAPLSRQPVKRNGLDEGPLIQ